MTASKEYLANGEPQKPDRGAVTAKGSSRGGANILCVALQKSQGGRREKTIKEGPQPWVKTESQSESEYLGLHHLLQDTPYPVGVESDEGLSLISSSP
ncbi:hypothetical protein AND_008399 [Anopheles darlingi]|uniref:Uncharacterized protein n=1 Tax=Anopheles darlingi TaxID=43151 RepID=W5J6D0_ANODA|nr:hypothetical protein AND_008399 [Anopheles darlingi]